MIKKILLFILLLLIVIPLGLFFYWQKQTLPVDITNKEIQVFVVPKGWGVEKIGSKLQEEGLVRNELVFKIMVLKEGIAQKIQAGDFRLSPSMNLFEISQALTHGTLDIWVTIPEALRREEIALIFNKSFANQGAIFDTKSFITKTASLEGMLFPDTYLIPKTDNIEEIIKILNDNFEEKYRQLKINSNLSKKQIVTLASLVEREVKHDKDRPIIAGIFLKRLRNNWPLQVDATIQYTVATQNSLFLVKEKEQVLENEIKWWPQIHAWDLKQIDSPYNTYKNQGLPPTPICNPGLASLRAVTNSQDSNYWFYLSDNSGNIHYAVTNEEHEKNIAAFLTP